MRNLFVSAMLLLVIATLPSCKGRNRNSHYASSLSDSTGKVVRILDGDTYELLTSDKRTIRIRMAGIDAPEKGQPFYKKAKDFLGELCFRKNVRIEKVNTDQYGRIVAWTYVDNGTSLSFEMVKKGFAWHFLKYDSSPELDTLEKQAREQHIGLWADANPMAPWDIRAHRRSGKKDNED
jgi:micrococcal nuclease